MRNLHNGKFQLSAQRGRKDACVTAPLPHLESASGWVEDASAEQAAQQARAKFDQNIANTGNDNETQEKSKESFREVEKTAGEMGPASGLPWLHGSDKHLKAH